jgi:hypothetical protein
MCRVCCPETCKDCDDREANNDCKNRKDGCWNTYCNRCEERNLTDGFCLDCYAKENASKAFEILERLIELNEDANNIDEIKKTLVDLKDLIRDNIDSSI